MLVQILFKLIDVIFIFKFMHIDMMLLLYIYINMYVVMLVYE